VQADSQIFRIENVKTTETVEEQFKEVKGEATGSRT
jgi:hypothetical protein